MSTAPLPTEEDVLAALLVVHVVGVHGAPMDAWLSVPLCLRALLEAMAGGAQGTAALERAIADSERRLDCERARDAVVEAARTWKESVPPPHTPKVPTFYEDLKLYRGVEALDRAEAEVSRHGG